VTFSRDLARLASASRDNTVKIWNMSSGKCLQTLKDHSDSVNSMIFSRDSTLLASASWDETIKIWDASSGKCLQTLEGHGGPINSVAFSRDSARLASASDDGTVKIWDANGNCLQTLKAHSGLVYSVAFSRNSTWLASSSHDGIVKIWDASSGNCLQTLYVGKALHDISFDTTGSRLHTEIGTISIYVSSASFTTPIVMKSQRPRYKYEGGGLSSDRAWITYDSENLVWLPSEYRPSCSVVSMNKVGIGVGSGRVWICSFNVENSQDSVKVS
jgi:WD40 repeat protein